MGSTLFWGLLLVVIGLSLIFKIVFNIDFPLLKIIIAFAFIFLGIKMLFGSFGSSDRLKEGENESDVFFKEKRYDNFNKHKDYNVIFGKGVYDFREYDLENDARKIKISSVFGSADIKLNKDLPVKIKVDAAFAGAQLPNGNSAVFGTSVYESPELNPNLPFLEIKIDVVFGGVDVRLY